MDDYITVSQFSEKFGKDKCNVHKLIKAGRIPAKRIGSIWLIPADAEYPPDARVKSGKYKNWRKPTGE